MRAELLAAPPQREGVRGQRTGEPEAFGWVELPAELGALRWRHAGAIDHLGIVEDVLADLKRDAAAHEDGRIERVADGGEGRGEPVVKQDDNAKCHVVDCR